MRPLPAARSSLVRHNVVLLCVSVLTVAGGAQVVGEGDVPFESGDFGLVDSYFNETRLIAELLQGYSHALPPRSRTRAPVEVGVQLVLLKILEVNTQLESLEIQGWLRQAWTDPKLQVCSPVGCLVPLSTCNN
jgi:hypothetical protein